MTVFIDTSAFYAVLDRGDRNHESAKREWARLLNSSTPVVTTNYVLVETAALVQHRLGIDALRAFHEDVVPLTPAVWISEEAHRAAMEAVLVAGRKRLSLVDCASFHVMRQLGLRRVFCFDAHFSEQGFTTLPESAPIEP